MTAVRRLRTRRTQVLAAGVGATLLALFATGCPEPADLADPAMYPAPVAPMTEMCETACIKDVFQVKASGCKICHGPTPLGALDLVSPGFTDRLRDVPAKHVEIAPPASPGDCPTNDKLIDPNNPNASWLLIKVRGMQKTCGTQMPTAPLPAGDMKCVEDYVACVAGKPITAGGGSGGGGAPMGGSGGSGSGGGGAPGGGSGGSATAGSGGAAAGSGGRPPGTGGGGGTGGT